MIEWLRMGDWFEDWAGVALVAAAAGTAAWLALRFAVSPVLRRLAAPHVVLRTMFEASAPAARTVLVLLTVQVVLNFAPDDLVGVGRGRLAFQLVMIAALSWFGIRVVNAIAAAVVALNPLDVDDNLQARRVVTQARVLAHIANGFVLAVGASLVLMAFPGLRQIGTSLLASAGVAGIVIGFAARSVFSNIIAGLQIALTQPIRLDDVLIVDGEWGRVEEIRGTYVVLRIWDERRLIVPLQWFIDHPFQNWTRRSAQLLGTVFVWLDWRVPVDALREEVARIAAAAPEWDGRVCVVQVTDCNERAVQVRILVSAGDSGRAFDLRCRVREAIIVFVQRRFPDALPRFRAELGRGEAPLQEALASGSAPRA